MSSCNPWSVNNIQEFWFLTCPQCSFKTKEENKFQDHAVENHPQSFELFHDDSKEFEDKLKIVDVEDEASDLDNDQLDHQYKKREMKPRSNWNKKSASPYCESLTARMQPADFGDPKLFKVVYMLSKIFQLNVGLRDLFQSEQLIKNENYFHIK